MQNTRFIILNGPPYSGKSTIARELSSYLREKHIPTVSDSFAAPMKHFIATALGEQYAVLPKDAPRAELAGYSVREFLIDLSENYIKPHYGDGAYGRWLYHRIGRLNPAPTFVIADDGGFIEEFDALSGGNRKRIVLIKITRPKHDFSNDSRNYLPIDPDFTIENDGDLASLWLKTKQLSELLATGRM